jgi:hypothetical protein
MEKKHKVVKDWINKYRFTFIGLLETNITYNHMGRVETTINPPS